MDWMVYMILASNKAIYTGITKDIERRWQQHSGMRAGGAKFFNGKKPVALVYVEKGLDRSSASKREYEIKQLTRKEKELLLGAEENNVSCYSGILPVKSG